MKRSIWCAFLHFSGVKEELRGHASPGKSELSECQKSWFWHSVRLFALLQMPSLQNLKDESSVLNPVFFLLTPPFKPYFFHAPPSNPTSPPLPDKK